MNGACVEYKDQADAQCGEGGAACASCASGQACGGDGACECTQDSCDGWCHGATCERFETLATDQPTFPATRGIATATSDVYWLSSSSTDTAANKWRVQHRAASGSAETLLSNQNPSLQWLLFGTERLFFMHSSSQQDSIQSMQADGSDARTDATGALTLRYHGGRIYWHDQEPPSDGGLAGAWYNVTIKSESETNPSDVAQYQGRVGRADADGSAEIADIAFAGGGIAFGLNSLTAPEGNSNWYEIAIITSNSSATSNSPNVFGSRPGRIEQLECDAKDTYYWLAKPSTSVGDDLLMQSDGAPDATSITNALNVTDFALFEPSSGKTVVYYAYIDPADQSTGVRLYDTSSGKSYDVLNGNKTGSLTVDDTYLYFFETNGHRLVRTPLPHVVLGLDK